jgi:hypothetical protein
MLMLRRKVAGGLLLNLDKNFPARFLSPPLSSNQASIIKSQKICKAPTI